MKFWRPNKDVVIAGKTIIRLSRVKERLRQDRDRPELLESLRVHRDSRLPVGDRLKSCHICRQIYESDGEIPLWKAKSLWRDHDRSVLGHHGPLPLWMQRVEGGAPTTYYIDPAGNNSNDGSIGSPWLTPGKAITTMVAGDTTIVNAGTYTSGLDQTISAKAGTDGNEFTFQAADPNDKPIWKPGSGNRVITLDNSSDFWDWTNIIFDGTNVSFDCFKADRTGNGSSDGDFSGCEFINSPTGHGWLGVVDTDNFSFTDCKFDNNGDEDSDHGVYYQGDTGVFLTCSGENNNGYAFHLYIDADSCTVDRCYALNNNASGLGTDFASGFITQGQSNIVRNCYSSGSNQESGFQCASGGSGTENKFVNCTTEGNRDYGFIARGHVHIRNCVMDNNPTGDIFTDGSTTLTESTNHKEADGDPKFVDATNDDFHLLAASPLIDTGSDESGNGVTVDFDANPRPQGSSYDIGAYERVGAAAQSNIGPIGIIRKLMKVAKL